MTTPRTPVAQPLPAGTQRLEALAIDVWHKSAPSDVRKAMADGRLPHGWRAWVRHLSKRTRPACPNDLLPKGESAILWGIAPEDATYPPEMAFPDGIGSNGSADGAEQRILRWMDEAAGETPGIRYALSALAWARRLPRVAEQWSADGWFALLAHLIEAVQEAGSIDVEQQPLLAQWLAGELPLTLAYQFPELKPCRALEPSARRALSAGLTDLLDGEGLVHGRHFTLMRPLLACWTRCSVLGENMKRPCFTSPARRQYEFMVRHVLRFARHDGSAMLGPAVQDGDKDLLRAAVAAGGHSADRAIAALTLPAAAAKAGKKPRADALANPAMQSEWAATALLRPGWSRAGERLAVVYPGQTVQVELGCGKQVLFSGSWSLEVTLDGKPLTLESDWEQVCWVSDDDIDYLELEIAMEGGIRVQRQMALARKDRFLFLADAVLGDRPGKLEYRARLALGAGIDFRPAKESREGCLHGAKPRALVFPLALAEWRSLWAAGELQAVASDLELSHTAQAGRLYAPLFFDLDRRRFARPCTWRRLTVAEALEVQPDDVAVGHRLVVGGSQWLVYRSLAEKGNRTLLGHNLSSEALLARFDSTGEVEPLIEVE